MQPPGEPVLTGELAVVPGGGVHAAGLHHRSPGSVHALRQRSLVRRAALPFRKVPLGTSGCGGGIPAWKGLWDVGRGCSGSWWGCSRMSGCALGDKVGIDGFGGIL